MTSDKATTKILIVDDEADIRDSLVLLLQGWGYRLVDTASHSQEGLQKLAAAPYDLLLLDMIMPRQSGWAVLDELKHLRTPVRVVVVSAVGLPMVVRQEILGKYKGVEFVSKTRVTEDLEELMAEMLRRPAAPI